ncbi:hypothetical protein VE01_08231 [Pseudogymnoascus verrucosus]|uniref:DNA recombination and repair protein Rad51-like C-terminal domain-containing protein n=1 Tax=Pseudogymnoascus verrucosus TaxID=342668 RepID=A0A1B8GDQ1_9PEZI|nr:uncharacterized protein VE01_08231 [Pseudogymnoascus verrucosus]OBT93958.1 hypothetical protein VE01_08231 [Pseudogymnoascus verrucosus]
MDDSTPLRHFHPPVSASTLLARLRISQIDPATGLKLPRLRTGVRDVDEYLLGGGVQRGCVVGVSSGLTSPNRGGREYPAAADAEEGGDTGRLVAMHILARSLLERPHSHASIIDSTGSFPLALFAGVVRWCVERGGGSGVGDAGGAGREGGKGGKGGTGGAGGAGGAGRKGGGGKGEVEEKVNAVLERVGVTRIFDIEGLWEVLGEVGGGAMGGADRRDEAKEASMGEEGRGAEDMGLGEEEEGDDGMPREALPTAAGVREIMDSEEEDDEDDDLATQRLPNPRPQSPQDRPGSNINIHKPSAPAAPTTHPTTEIILLDNLTTLTTTLFSRTSTPLAHHLLSQLSRTLTTLARSSSVTIFLLNTLVRKSTKTAAGNPEQQRKKEQEKQHSVFAGMTATPSLGVVFDGFVDLHLMCFALPRGREDAEGVFGVELPGDDGELRDDEEDGGATGERGARREGRGEGDRFANVIEVLKDECPQLERWEGVSDGKPGRGVDREKRWAAFGVVGGVGLVDEVFEGAGEE